VEDRSRNLTADLEELRDKGEHTHFLGIGNAKRKRTEKCRFIGLFEGFGGDEGKRAGNGHGPVLNVFRTPPCGVGRRTRKGGKGFRVKV
jgi:hypothetical protein